MGSRRYRSFRNWTGGSHYFAVFAYLAFFGCIFNAVASQDEPTKAELLATVKHIETLAVTAQQDLAAEKQAHAQTQAALVAAQQATTDTQNQFNTYQKAAETEIAKGNAAIAQLNSVIKKLHRAKWILCGIWVLLCGIIITKIPLPLKQYGLYAGLGLMAAGCAAIWLWV